MGQGAEDADIAADLGHTQLYAPRDRWHRKATAGQKPRRVLFQGEEAARPRRGGKVRSETTHYPETDSEAKAIIERLNHYEWDTHQVRGRFDRNPYSLSATIDGRKHIIKIKGRFGGVMKWLDRKERELVGRVA